MTIDFKHTKAKINNAIEKSTNKKDILNKIGKAVTKNVKADSRNGKDYKGKSFPGLADSTIDQRDYLDAYNRTHADYSTERSNVTFTGKTIDAIEHSVDGQKIIIEAEGTHPPLKGKHGRYKHSSSYSDILNGLWDLGRKIMGLSKESKKKAITEIKREFRRSLRNNK